MSDTNRTGKAERLLSEEQIQDLIAWAYITPGSRDWKVIKAKLEELGVVVANDAVFKFMGDRVDPGLDNLGTIRAAAAFAKDVGIALGAEDADAVTRAANLLQQQAAFDWALKHKVAGTYNLDDPVFLETFIEVSKATRSGLVAVDRKAITDARVQTLEAKLKEMELKATAAAHAVDSLTQPGAEGMSIAARNVIRAELGLKPLTPEEAA